MDDAGIEALLAEAREYCAEAADPLFPPIPVPVAVAEEEEEEEIRPRKRSKKKSRSKRARKRARMLAFSDEEPEPVSTGKRRGSSSDDDDPVLFAEPDSAPESPPESPPTLTDILHFGEDLFGEDLQDDDDEPQEKSDDDIGAAPAPAPADEIDVRQIDVRAYDLVSVHPPTMVFMMGKKRADAVPVTLVGDLVRELSCPLHMFCVKVKPVPGSVSDNGSPVLFVLDVVKVIAGPIPDAVKSAAAAAEFANSAIIGDSVSKVPVARLKRMISASGYLKRAQYKAALVKKMFHRLYEKFKSAPLTPEALEDFAPADGNSQMSWMCRNALEPARFFEAANKIGGAAVRAIGLDSNKAMWDMINEVPDGDDETRQERVIELLKKIHFANPLCEFRASRLHAALNICTSRELVDSVECIVRAAAVVHNLPSAADVQDDRYRNAIVRGEQGDVWPEPMLRMLRWYGLHVDRDSSQRWYACQQQTRQFYSRVVETMNAGTVRFVRAEIDDDHTVADEDRGYIERLRSAVSEHKHSLLVLSKTTVRVGYLRHHTGGYGAKFLEYKTFVGNFAPKESTVIWIDRAHIFDSNELTRLLSDWSSVVKAIYLAGSTWAGTTHYEVTLFAQLFAGANNGACETLTASLAEYKAAPVGSNPLEEGAKARMPGTPIIVGRFSAACPESVSSMYPDSRVYSVAQLAARFDEMSRAAIVLYDKQWTCQDLATVWLHVLPIENAIWMLGGEDWRPSLSRTSRSTAGSTALIQKLS